MVGYSDTIYNVKLNKQVKKRSQRGRSLVKLLGASPVNCIIFTLVHPAQIRAHFNI